MTKKKLPNLQESLKILLSDIELKKFPVTKLFEEGFRAQLTNLTNYPHAEYSYKCPDYALQTVPKAEYLQHIEQLDWRFDIPHRYIEELLSHPPQELATDLENLLLHGLAEFARRPKKEFPSMQPKFIIASLLLKETNSRNSLDSILELFRQDMDFYFTQFENFGPIVFPPIIYQLGNNQLPKLLKFMKEPGLLPFGKNYISMAVANIAITQPERRIEVMVWFCQVLDFFKKHLRDETVFDGTVIDSMAFDLLNINGKETLPLLKELYASQLIMPFMAPDYEEICQTINDQKPVALLDNNIYDTLKELETCCTYIDEECNEETSDNEEKSQFEASFFELYREVLHTSQKQRALLQAPKCYTLNIELCHTEPSVWRQIEVPSTLPLELLHRVIQMAMGWEDYHLHLFKKGNTVYTSNEVLESNLSIGRKIQVDYTNITLAELMTRKGSKIEYEYDLVNPWLHHIVLVEQRPYKKKESPRIYLHNGANSCPPEGCGGIAGYKELIERNKKESATSTEGGFDPTVFDKATVNNLLLKLL